VHEKNETSTTTSTIFEPTEPKTSVRTAPIGSVFSPATTAPMSGTAST
jgi:hypothetical protein